MNNRVALQGHDFEVIREYLTDLGQKIGGCHETVVCRKCTMRFVRNMDTKLPIPAELDEIFGRWECDDFNNLTIVSHVMES